MSFLTFSSIDSVQTREHRFIYFSTIQQQKKTLHLNILFPYYKNFITYRRRAIYTYMKFHSFQFPVYATTTRATHSARIAICNLITEAYNGLHTKSLLCIYRNACISARDEIPICRTLCIGSSYKRVFIQVGVYISCLAAFKIFFSLRMC